VVPVKAYLNAPAHNDEALPNTTFRATEMAGSSAQMRVRISPWAPITAYNYL
jgi:hypothetical protein